MINALCGSTKLVNLCKFTAWCRDVLADKPHLRFDVKILNKKVRLFAQNLACNNFLLKAYIVYLYIVSQGDFQA